MILMEENDMASFQNKTKLENIIRDLLNEVSNSKYTSSLNVEYEDGIYTLQMGLNCKDASPVSIVYQGDESGFLDYLAKEFRRKRFAGVDYNTNTIINGEGNWFYAIIEL